MSNRDEDFLSRWSRRKVEARQGLRKKESDTPSAIAQISGSEQAALSREIVSKPPAAERDADQSPADEEHAIDEAEFADVDFDKLDYNSDYTRFMKKGVPAAIQRRALRKLWTSDPVLACVDGLNDYDLDYTDAATVVKDLKTSWEIGRGFQTDEDLGIAKAPDQAEDAPPESGVAGSMASDTVESDGAAAETDPEADDAQRADTAAAPRADTTAAQRADTAAAQRADEHDKG